MKEIIKKVLTDKRFRNATALSAFMLTVTGGTFGAWSG